MPSTPALLETTVRFFTPESRIASDRVSAIPQRPKPPDMIIMPSLRRPSSADLASGYTLFMKSDLMEGGRGGRRRGRGAGGGGGTLHAFGIAETPPHPGPLPASGLREQGGSPAALKASRKHFRLRNLAGGSYPAFTLPLFSCGLDFRSPRLNRVNQTMD